MFTMQWPFFYLLLTHVASAQQTTVVQYNGNNSPEEQIRGQQASLCKIPVATGVQPNGCVNYCSQQLLAADDGMNSQTCVGTGDPEQTDGTCSQNILSITMS